MQASAVFFFRTTLDRRARAVHLQLMKLRVPDMSCGHCVATIERAIHAEDASARVACDLGTRTVEVEGRIDAPAVLAALAAAGYAAQPA